MLLVCDFSDIFYSEYLQAFFPAQPRLALNWFKIASYFSDSDTEALAVCSSWWHQNVVFSRAKSRSARSCPIAIMHHLTPNLLSLAKQGDVFERLWFCSDMSWNLSKELMNHPKEIGPFTFTLQILKHIQYRLIDNLGWFGGFPFPSIYLALPLEVRLCLLNFHDQWKDTSSQNSLATEWLFALFRPRLIPEPDVITREVKVHWVSAAVVFGDGGGT